MPVRLRMQTRPQSEKPMMSERPYSVHPSAYVDEPCIIGAGTRIWHFCHVMAGAVIGEQIGRAHV